MARIVGSVSLAFIIVAFSFILLTMLNASDEGELVWLGEADAGVIVAMAAAGLVFAFVLGIKMLLDGRRRLELEEQAREPRRKSDAARTPDDLR